MFAINENVCTTIGTKYESQQLQNFAKWLCKPKSVQLLKHFKNNDSFYGVTRRRIIQGHLSTYRVSNVEERNLTLSSTFCCPATLLRITGSILEETYQKPGLK